MNCNLSFRAAVETQCFQAIFFLFSLLATYNIACKFFMLSKESKQ